MLIKSRMDRVFEWIVGNFNGYGAMSGATLCRI